MSPIGTFLPWDDADTEGRFFARPSAFEMECPQCGRLFLVGPYRRDNRSYDRVSGILTCPKNVDPTKPGCGRKWFIGIVAYQILAGNRKTRPLDQKPNARQLAELRQWGRGVMSRNLKKRGEAINAVIRDPEDTEPRREPDDDT